MSESRSLHPSPVALDAMGGDFGVVPNVEGAIAAAKEDGVCTILVGDQSILEAEIARQGGQAMIDRGLLRIHHAPDVIEMDEKPSAAVRKKKNASMRVACDLVKAGDAKAVLTAGNSGAFMALTLVVFGRIKGVSRPCIAAILPSANGWTVLLDAGANIDCSAQLLFQFALMGEVYVRKNLQVAAPKIGVLANGTEPTKGTELTREVLALLQQTDLNVEGHIEMSALRKGTVDVVTTDGFTGNVALKTAEATAGLVVDTIKSTYRNSGVIGKIGAILSKKVFQTLAETMDPRAAGAAPLFGLKHPCFVAHGSSDAVAIQSGLLGASRYRAEAVTEGIAEAMARYNPSTKPAAMGQTGS